MYTVKEVAQRLKVEPQTVRHWIRDGTLRAFKVGRTWRITAASVANLVDGVEPTGPASFPPAIESDDEAGGEYEDGGGEIRLEEQLRRRSSCL
jgi:excisionase family DNA binding protein